LGLGGINSKYLFFISSKRRSKIVTYNKCEILARAAGIMFFKMPTHQEQKVALDKVLSNNTKIFGAGL